MEYILVTGAANGIGLATSKRLLDKGYYVIGLDIAKSNILNNNHYHHIICDVTSNDDVNKAYIEISKITDKLKAIYDIAGIFMLQSVVEGNVDDMKKIIDINFLGAFRINKTMVPLLDEHSKIIVFSSEVARYSPQPFNGYYALSKVVVDTYATILRRELNYLNIKVIKVQCGAIKTNLLTSVNDKYVKTVENTKYYKKPLTKLKHLMDNEINKQVDPIVVAVKLVKIMEKKHNKLLYRIKNSFKLRFLNSLPERIQDIIYKAVIR